MKTRSNMPLFVVECTDITKLTDGQIDLLHCGDYLVKKTGKQRHAYKVTYKEDKQGICLTYHDASTVETVSYDYSGEHWVYNSTDKASLPMKDGSKYVFDGDLDVDGKITGDEIVENMSGYTASIATITGLTIENVYTSVVKNGNKITFVMALNITKTDSDLTNNKIVGYIGVPNSILEKLIPTRVGSFDFLANDVLNAFSDFNSSISLKAYIQKATTYITFSLYNLTDLTLNSKYYVRYEKTFLLSDNLING